MKHMMVFCDGKIRFSESIATAFDVQANYILLRNICYVKKEEVFGIIDEVNLPKKTKILFDGKIHNDSLLNEMVEFGIYPVSYWKQFIEEYDKLKFEKNLLREKILNKINPSEKNKLSFSVSDDDRSYLSKSIATCYRVCNGKIKLHNFCYIPKLDSFEFNQDIHLPKRIIKFFNEKYEYEVSKEEMELFGIIDINDLRKMVTNYESLKVDFDNQRQKVLNLPYSEEYKNYGLKKN